MKKVNAMSCANSRLTATNPIKWLRVSMLGFAALTLAGCSLPTAKADLARQSSQTERSLRMTYGKNQQLASRACQDFSANPAPACASTKTRHEQHMVSAVLDPALLGFAPVDRREASEFSLEIARDEARKAAPPLAFGMLSGSFGQSWGYDLTLRHRTADAGL